MKLSPHVGLVLSLLFISSAASGAVAQSDPGTAFGFKLGAPLSISECAKHRSGRTMLYEPSTKMVCYKRTSQNVTEPGSIGTEMVTITFPPFEKPEAVAGYSLLGWMIDGTLEGVTFDTGGIERADAVLAALKEKYGEPKSFEPYDVQNGLGARFTVFDATWDTGAVRVIFNSVGHTVDHGTVRIQTRKAAEIYDQGRANRTGGPSL